jgi:dihydroorotase
LPFAEAEPGATGLELLLSLTLKWATESGTPLAHALGSVTARPAAVMGAALGTLQSSVGRLHVGAAADLCVFDPAERWVVEPSKLHSQGKHTPFSGYELPGKVRSTLVAGHIAYSAI